VETGEIQIWGREVNEERMEKGKGGKNKKREGAKREGKR